MKSKALISIAVASTFGWSAASYAGSSHEVVTPFSPNESGEVIFSYKEGFGSSQAMGSTSDHGSGVVSGSYSDSTSLSTMPGESASLDMRSDSLAAADEGIYTDYYLVSWKPAETWDYYVIDDGASAQLVDISDYDIWVPTHELALVPSAADEMTYELVLVPIDTGDMTASFFDSSSDALGE
jgi:hypothetical protein